MKRGKKAQCVSHRCKYLFEQKKYFGVRCTLNGNWYNLPGYEMIVEQGENNRITGEFRTAVEREKGTAGTSHSNVLGIGQLGARTVLLLSL